MTNSKSVPTPGGKYKHATHPPRSCHYHHYPPSASQKRKDLLRICSRAYNSSTWRGWGQEFKTRLGLYGKNWGWEEEIELRSTSQSPFPNILSLNLFFLASSLSPHPKTTREKPAAFVADRLEEIWASSVPWSMYEQERRTSNVISSPLLWQKYICN